MPRSSQLPPARSLLWLGSCNRTYWGELHWNTPASDCRIGFARSVLCWTLRAWEPSNCWSWPHFLYLSWSCHIISVMMAQTLSACLNLICIMPPDSMSMTIDKQYFKQYQQLPTWLTNIYQTNTHFESVDTWNSIRLSIISFEAYPLEC